MAAIGSHIDFTEWNIISPQQFCRRRNLAAGNTQTITAALFLHPSGCALYMAIQSCFFQQSLCPLGRSHGPEGDQTKLHTQKPPGPIYAREVFYVIELFFFQ
jgi:hypothetical protein